MWEEHWHSIMSLAVKAKQWVYRSSEQIVRYPGRKYHILNDCVAKDIFYPFLHKFLDEESSVMY